MAFVFLLAAATASATATQWRQKLLNGSNHNKYCTYEEYDALLEEMMKKYPKLLRKEKVGESFQKRPLNVYHFVDQDSKLQKDEVFINSLMHPREAQTVLTLFDYLTRTLEAIDKGDPQALYTIKRRHIVLMPFVNIDSYIANEKSRRHLIRKNQRDVCANRGEGKNGVDLNRNYPVGWEEASNDKCSETYRGAKPFSEPETQALKSVVEHHKFKVSYTIHGYGQMLLRPGGAFVLVPDNHVKVFDEFQQVIKAEKYGTVEDVISYKATGGTDDWLYRDHKIFAMTPEVGTAFWQRAGERAGLLTKEWLRTRYVVYKAGCEPRVDLSNSGSEFSVANDGVSDCPLLKLAFSGSGGDPVVVDVGAITARGSKKTPGKVGDVKNVCVKEEGLDICLCNPTSLGKGTWVNTENALCAALVTPDSSPAPPSSSPAPPSSSPAPPSSSPAPPSSSPAPTSPAPSPPSSDPSSSPDPSSPAPSPASSPSSPSPPSSAGSSSKGGIQTTHIIILSVTIAVLALLALLYRYNNQKSETHDIGPMMPRDEKTRRPGKKHGRVKHMSTKAQSKVKSVRRE
eukprot:GEMP01017553.1.p1 GENE.GEMP01017553.1~~GEMP01017553.1.p1  ORF type:complete len:570 (+),score=82.51 GEMP01017553.1:490-2199(+)